MHYNVYYNIIHGIQLLKFSISFFRYFFYQESSAQQCDSINIKRFKRVVKAVQLSFPGGKADGYCRNSSSRNGWILKA